MSTPLASLAMITLDCDDVAPEVAFWGAVLGWETAYAGEEYAMLTHGPARLGFGRVEGYEPPAWPDAGGRKQFHLDLAVDGDLDDAVSRAEALGARAIDPQPGETWRVMLDPAGHPFCLTAASAWG